MAYVYILRCADGSLYVGYTGDVVRRESTHNEGRGGSYTAQRRPVKVVYVEQFTNAKMARARERQLKRWSGRKKEALVAGERSRLKRLARCKKIVGSQRLVYQGAVEGIRRGVEDVNAGRTRPADEFLDEFARKHGLPR